MEIRIIYPHGVKINDSCTVPLKRHEPFAIAPLNHTIMMLLFLLYPFSEFNDCMNIPMMVIFSRDFRL